MKSTKKILCLSFIIFLSGICSAQKVDSLMQVFKSDKLSDSEKIKFIEDEHLFYQVFREAHNNPTKAINYIESINELFKTEDDKISKGIICDIYGAAYTFKGDRLTSLNWFLKGLKYRERINDTVKAKNRALSASYTNIGEIHLEEKMYDKAKIYYLKSLEFSKKAKDDSALLYDYINLGNLYLETKKYDQAEKHFFNCFSIIEKNNNSKFKEMAAISLSGLGDVYFETGNINKSIAYYEKSIDDSQKADNLTIVKSNIGLGKAYLWQADSINNTKQYIIHDLYLKAANYGNKALQLAQESGFLEEISYSSENLYKIYKTINNSNKALELHEIFVKSSDSIKKLDAKREILKIEYQERYEREQLKNELELKEKTFKRNVFFAFTLLVFSGLIAFFFIKNRKVKKEKNRLLAELENIKSKAIYSIEDSTKKLDHIELNKEKIEAFIGAKLNPTDWKILNNLYENPSLTAKELGNIISLSPQGVYSSLKKMYRLFDLHQKNENQRLALVIAALKLSGYNYFSK